MAEKPKKTVRLLVDQDINGKKYKCNQAVTLDAERAAALVKQGMADDAKAAVECAVQENGEAIDIISNPVVDSEDPPKDPPV